MKFTLRRGVDIPDAAEDATPAAPQPPQGRPVVAYAAILDGRTLWLATAATPGALALRETTSGDTVALSSDAGDDQPAYRSIRVDLDELPGTEQVSYDAVLVPAGGGSPKPLWTHPLPEEPLVQPPVSADGSHRWDLAREEDGTLRVVRTPLEPTVALRAIGLDGERVVITTDPVEDPDQCRIRLVTAQGAVVLDLPTTRSQDGLLHASLGLADLPLGDRVWPRVLVGDAPVRRRADDLPGAQSATMLPMLFGEDPEEPELRFRFTPGGLLGIRIVARPVGGA